MPDELPTQTFHLPQKERALVDAALSAAQKGEWARRLWAKDASLWTGKDEAQWLGWLDLLPASPNALAGYKAIADEVKKDELEDVVLMGMGGSSMAPEVLAATFGIAKGYPKLHILDSTDPAQVAEVAAKVDLQRTLCVVASKSGSTLEPACFLAYFQHRLESNVGVEAPRRIVAITDPGSKLEAQAKAGKFRATVNGRPIGGREVSRFGTYRAAVPPGLLRPGRNRVEIVGEQGNMFAGFADLSVEAPPALFAAPPARPRPAAPPPRPTIGLAGMLSGR